MRAGAIISLVTVLATGWWTAAGGQVASPEKATPLVDAWWSGDRAAIERAGFAAGASGLARALESGHRERMLAALEAAPAAEDGWAILDRLAHLCASPDRTIAAAAAHAAAGIATDLDRDRALMLDIPPPVLTRLGADYLAVAKDPRRFPDVRVLAVDAYTHLAAAARPDAQEAITLALFSLMDSPEPEIRRVAIERLPLPLAPATVANLARRIAIEPSDAVAVVAAQAACGPLAFGENARPVLRAMGEAGRRRLRKLIGFQSLSISPRLDAALCIAADEHRESRSALRKFRAGINRDARRNFDIRRGTR